MPTLALAGPTSLPKISHTQISADRAGSSSKPIIHSAHMQRGSSSAAMRTSMRAYWGV